MKFLYVICTWISYLYCCNISFNFAVGPQRNHCKFYSICWLIFFQYFIYRTVNMDHRNWGRRKKWIGLLEWSCLNLFGRRHARWSVRTRPFICNILLKTRLTVVFACLIYTIYSYLSASVINFVVGPQRNHCKPSLIFGWCLIPDLLFSLLI